MKLNYLAPILFFITFIGSGLITTTEVKSAETISEERYNKICRWGILNPPECKKRLIKSTPRNTKKNTKTTKQIKEYDRDCKWGIFNPPKCRGKDSRIKESARNKSYKKEATKRKMKSFEEENNNILIYTGTFDTIDTVGDDRSKLVGMEHKNSDLFRDTWVGRFSPTTGAFVTSKSSIYLYSGIEADYNLGFLNISPSFAPGYYSAGDGKNLGSALEFKSEVKIGIDLFQNSNLGYSYSHISNNDWGNVNPGTDNQSITFSKKF